MSTEQDEGPNEPQPSTATETARADLLALLGRPAFFVNRGMPAGDFDARLNRGRMWLPEGARLLRAAIVLMRQHDKDEPARFAPSRLARIGRRRWCIRRSCSRRWRPSAR